MPLWEHCLEALQERSPYWEHFIKCSAWTWPSVIKTINDHVLWSDETKIKLFDHTHNQYVGQQKETSYEEVPGTQCKIWVWITDALFCGSGALVKMASWILPSTRMFQSNSWLLLAGDSDLAICFGTTILVSGFELHWKPVVWNEESSPHAQT